MKLDLHYVDPRLVMAGGDAYSEVPDVRVDYRYDAEGGLVERRYQTGEGQPEVTRYAYDGTNVWAHLTEEDQLRARFFREAMARGWPVLACAPEPS